MLTWRNLTLINVVSLLRSFQQDKRNLSHGLSTQISLGKVRVQLELVLSGSKWHGVGHAYHWRFSF